MSDIACDILALQSMLDSLKLKATSAAATRSVELERLVKADEAYSEIADQFEDKGAEALQQLNPAVWALYHLISTSKKVSSTEYEAFYSLIDLIDDEEKASLLKRLVGRRQALLGAMRDVKNRFCPE